RRQDLRRVGAEAATSDPGAAPGRHPASSVERDPAGRAAQAVACEVVGAVPEGRQGDRLAGTDAGPGRESGPAPRPAANGEDGADVSNGSAAVPAAPARRRGATRRLRRLDTKVSPYLY